MLISQHNPQSAQTALDNFRAENSNAMFALACHAALPNVINPDLLQTIRINFHFDLGENHQEIAWEEGIRLLLSGLLSPSGDAYYAMDVEVRRKFVQQLEEDYGKGRLELLSRFLLSYYESELESESNTGLSLAKLQQITAYAYLDPAMAHQEISLAFARLQGEGHSPQRMRLATLVDSLQDQLGLDLLQYARAWTHDIHNEVEQVRQQLQPLMDAEPLPGEAEMQITLPVPKEMFRQIKAEQLENDPHFETKKRIQQAINEKWETLDLSGMGIKDLPEELRDATHIQNLNLSHNQFEILPELPNSLQMLRALDLSDNLLRLIAPQPGSGLMVDRLVLNRNLLRRLPESFSQSFPVLKELEMESNQFQFISFDLLKSEIRLKLSDNSLPQKPISLDLDQQSSNISQSSPLQSSTESIGLSDLWADKAYLLERQETQIKDEVQSVQMLVWGYPFAPSHYPPFVLSDGRDETYQGQGKGNFFQRQHSLLRGEFFGLGAQHLLHSVIFSHESHQSGIQAFCSKNTFVAIHLVENGEDKSYEVESWLARLTDLGKQNIVLFVEDPLDPYLLELVERCKKMYDLSKVHLLNPRDELQTEKWLDFLAERIAQSALTTPGFSNYKRLIDLVFKENVVRFTDFQEVDSDIPIAGLGGFPPYWDTDQMTGLKILLDYAPVNTEGKFIGASLVTSIFEKAKGLAEKSPFWLDVLAFEEAVEREIRKVAGKDSTLVKILINLFLKYKWIYKKESPSKKSKTVESEFYLFPGHLLPNAFPVRKSEKALVVLHAEFKHLSPLLFDALLLEKFDPLTKEEYNLKFGDNWFSLNREDNLEIWRFDLVTNRISIFFSENKVDDRFFYATTSAVELITKVLPLLPYLTAPTFWIGSKQDDLNFDYRFLQKLQAKGIENIIGFNGKNWLSIRTVLGMDWELAQMPRSKKRNYLFLYAKSDFELVNPILIGLNDFDIKVVPYTIDLYSSPSLTFTSYASDFEKVIFFLSEHFIKSGTWLTQLIGETLMSPSNSLPDHFVLLREHTEPSGLQDLEILSAQHWNTLKGLPQPKLAVTADPFSLPKTSRAGMAFQAHQILEQQKRLFSLENYTHHFSLEELQSNGLSALAQSLDSSFRVPKVMGNWIAVYYEPDENRWAKVKEVFDKSEIVVRHVKTLENLTEIFKADSVGQLESKVNERFPINSCTVLILDNKEYLQAKTAHDWAFTSLVHLFEIGETPELSSPWPNLSLACNYEEFKDNDSVLLSKVTEIGNMQFDKVLAAPKSEGWRKKGYYLANYSLKDLYNYHRTDFGYSSREQEVSQIVAEQLKRNKKTLTKKKSTLSLRSSKRKDYFPKDFLKMWRLRQQVNQDISSKKRGFLANLKEMWLDLMVMRRSCLGLALIGLHPVEIHDFAKQQWTRITLGETGISNTLTFPKNEEFLSWLGFNPIIHLLDPSQHTVEEQLFLRKEKLKS